MSEGERLQKVLAHAGVTSRRAAERLILERRVTVNRAVATRLGIRVDPSRDAVRVDGRKIPTAPPSHTYLAMNKPRGCVTTLRDPENRPTVADLLEGTGSRVYPVGRLDFNSEGLLLFTDDGSLARDLMHPRSRVPKTYWAKVQGEPTREALLRLSRGIIVKGRRTLPAKASVMRSGGKSWIEMTVVEGRKHQVREMLEAIGHPVMRLRRVSYGGIDLGRLPVARVRTITAEEVRRLRSAVRPAMPPSSKVPGRRIPS